MCWYGFVTLSKTTRVFTRVRKWKLTGRETEKQREKNSKRWRDLKEVDTEIRGLENVGRKHAWERARKRERGERVGRGTVATAERRKTETGMNRVENSKERQEE